MQRETRHRLMNSLVPTSRRRSPLSFRERPRAFCMNQRRAFTTARRRRLRTRTTRGKRKRLTARNSDPHNNGNLYRIYANAPAACRAVPCQSFLFYYRVNNTDGRATYSENEYRIMMSSNGRIFISSARSPRLLTSLRICRELSDID